MDNNFSKLFSGLSPQQNSQKFKFIQNYGTSNSMTGFPGNKPQTSQSVTPGHMSVAPKQNMSIASANPSATSVAKPSPAKEQFINNLAPTGTTINSGGLGGTKIPAGWDAVTYQNFKKANPNLEPDAEDTFRMQNAGNPITGDTQTPSGATIDATTGALVNPAKVDPQQAYRDAMTAYIATLNPSAAESAASKNLADLTLQAKKDQETALNKGETQGFASGEAARVNRNNSFGIEAASNALDVFTANRTGQSNAQKARLDFEKSLLPSTDSFNLSLGETRFDAQGNEIASGGDEAQSISDQYGTGAIGEYNFAKSQGYKGSFTDYQNEDANRKAKSTGTGVITPSEKRAQETQQQADDVATAIVDFQTQMQQKNWKGANPEAYKYYRDELTKLYGASAALALDKAMKDAEIEVDKKK